MVGLHLSVPQTLMRRVFEMRLVSEVRRQSRWVFQNRVPMLMTSTGCRNAEASTRADLNEVPARSLTLHAFAGCRVRTFTSLDPQA